MPGRFPRLSKFVVRAVEIVGAGCVSAFAAVLLGNAHEPQRMSEAPVVVRLAPADEQMIRYVRDESAILAERLRSASDVLNATVPAPAAASPAPVAAAAAGKPGKGAAPAVATTPAVAPAPTSAPAPARREQKPNRSTSELRQRPWEPQAILNVIAPTRPELPRSSTAAATDSKDARVSAAASAAAGESALPAAPTQATPTQVTPMQVTPMQVTPMQVTPTQVPSRLFSDAASSVRDAPRPPLAVGPSVSSSM
jgi:hypothetical protein